MIEVESLNKFYGDLAAIHDVSFRVEKGEILGFLGPNAAGKTTTMRILTGYMPPTSGTVRVAGFDVFRDSLEVRKRIGYLPESVPLYRDMTVQAYLDYAASLRHVPKKAKAIERVSEQCGIKDVGDTLIGRLSKGYRQRVGLAQALVHDPEVLILDEPTVGLDPRQIIEVRNLIKGLGGEHTIILSTHILPEVSQTCGRVLIINQGHIVAEDTPQGLTERLMGAERVRVVARGSQDGLAQRLEAIDSVVRVDQTSDTEYEVLTELGMDRRAQIAATVVNSGWDLLEIRTVGMSLEEIFLRLTTEEVDVENA